MRRAGNVATLALLCLLAAGCGCRVNPQAGDPPPRGSTAKGARPKAGEAVQEKRRAVFEQFVRAGVFKGDFKYDGEAVVLVVGPAFYRLDFKDKAAAVSAFAAWYYDIPPGDRPQPSEVVRLVDSKTNKPVGSWDASGLTLD